MTKSQSDNFERHIHQCLNGAKHAKKWALQPASATHHEEVQPYLSLRTSARTALLTENAHKSSSTEEENGKRHQRDWNSGPWDFEMCALRLCHRSTKRKSPAIISSCYHHTSRCFTKERQGQFFEGTWTQVKMLTLSRKCRNLVAFFNSSVEKLLLDLDRAS